MDTSRTRRVRRVAALLVTLVLAALTASVASASTRAVQPQAPSPEQINGDGSSWAANAIGQWIGDVDSEGLRVVYTSTGSTTGRKDFANNQNQFADSDIAYGQDPNDPTDTANGRAYAYLPVVAGGTSFPYHLEVAGQLYRNLRLSGQTIAKIFTDQITNWNDPAITRDNNGHALPALPIVPVVRSDGSGATAQFTFYLDKMFPSIWETFYGHKGGTSYWPSGKGQQVSQNGSDQVMNYIASKAGNGTIAYDEYSYALQINYPVAKVENAAGYYVLPTQYNVAVGLTKAQVDETDVNDPSKYLTQILDDVYTNPDNRAYPLSSYSYFIIPTSSSDSQMNSGKRQALADYLYYSLCQGQAEMGPLGYSPLPINLVQDSFKQIAKLKQADPNIDISNQDVSTCNNPTFVAGQPDRNYLAEIAPQPAACDKDGAGPCGASDTTQTNANPTTTSKKGTKSSTKASSTPRGSRPANGSNGTSPATTGSLPGTASSGGQPQPAGASVAIDPVTGATVPAASSNGTATDAGAAGDASAALPTATTLASNAASGPTEVLAPLAVVLLLAIVVLPVVVSRWSGRRTPPGSP